MGPNLLVRLVAHYLRSAVNVPHWVIDPPELRLHDSCNRIFVTHNV